MKIADVLRQVADTLVKAAVQPLPEVTEKDPGLMTWQEFLDFRNPEGKMHPSNAYDFDLKKMNRDYSVVHKGSFKSNKGSFFVEGNKNGFIIYKHENEVDVIVSIVVDNVMYAAKHPPATSIPLTYFERGTKVDIEVETIKIVKYAADYVPLVSDVAAKNREQYTVLLQNIMVAGEPMQVRSQGNPGPNTSLAVLNQMGYVVAEATDEWGATLLVVAQEYRGKGLGKLIGRYWYKYNPDKKSGGMTPSGVSNAAKMWEDRVREFVANGWYSELVKQGAITKERVDEILSALKKSKPLEEAPKKEEGQVLLFLDDLEEPNSFVLYNSLFFQEREDKHIYAHGFFRSSESVGSFLFRIDYDRPYKEQATYIALQMARHNGEDIYVGEGYGDFLETDGLAHVQVDGDYVSLLKDVLPIKKLGLEEKRFRKKHDSYDEVYHSLVEMADTKWA